MNNNKKDNKRSVSVKEEYLNFLELHSMDLKYMVPWSQYEENNIEQNLKIRKNDGKIKEKYDDKKSHVQFLGQKSLKLYEQLNQFEVNE